MKLDELVQPEAPEQDTLQEDVTAAFHEAFGIEGLDVSREGNIIYFSGNVANRQIRINPLSDPGGYAWQLNGITFAYPIDAGATLEDRQQLLRQAILRIPEQRQPQQAAESTTQAL